jgi:hypothetical protein
MLRAGSRLGVRGSVNEASTIISSRRCIMPAQVQWETDMGKALARAGAEGKLVFVDFFNPG